jgi:hypothetical protein
MKTMAETWFLAKKRFGPAKTHRVNFKTSRNSKPRGLGLILKSARDWTRDKLFVSSFY